MVGRANSQLDRRILHVSVEMVRGGRADYCSKYGEGRHKKDFRRGE